MTTNINEAQALALKNRKKAYFAMSRATILVFVFSFLMSLLREGVVALISEHSIALEKFFVNIVCLFGVSKTNAFLAVRDVITSGAFYEVLQMIMVSMSLVIPCAIFARVAKINWQDSFNFKGKCIKGLFPTIGLCQIITGFVLVASSYVASFFIYPIFHLSSPETIAVSSEARLPEVIIMILSNAVFVPFVEEYAFRGVIFTYLRRFGTAYAMVASSLLFGIAHTSPEQSVFAFSFGLISAYALVVTGNIKTSIILHAVNNLVCVIDSYTFGTSGEAILFAVNLLVFGLGIFGVYYTLRKGGNLEVFNENRIKLDRSYGVCQYIGMGGIMTVPVVAFIILYAVNFVMEMV